MNDHDNKCLSEAHAWVTEILHGDYPIVEACIAGYLMAYLKLRPVDVRGRIDMDAARIAAYDDKVGVEPGEDQFPGITVITFGHAPIEFMDKNGRLLDL